MNSRKNQKSVKKISEIRRRRAQKNKQLKLKTSSKGLKKRIKLHQKNVKILHKILIKTHITFEKKIRIYF